MRHDIYTEITPRQALANTLNAALVSTTVNGDTIDLQNDVGGSFLVNVNALTGGTLTFQLQAGDQANMSDAANVTDANLVAGPVGTALAVAGMQKFGYFGIKRYVRLTATGNAGITGAVVHAVYAGMQPARGGF